MAVELVGRLHPDLVLMDVRMPGGDGVEATRRILHLFPGVKIVALTIHDDVDTVRDMLSAGASGYFLKGAPIDDLLSAVHRTTRGEGQIDERVLPSAIEELRRLLKEERGRRAEVERLASMRQEFIQVLSHELRTPLTVMAGALRLIERRGPHPDDATLIASALARAEEFERIIEGLELVGEAPPAQPESANPAQAVREVFQRLPERPDDSRLRDDTWPGVRHRHLARITFELLKNAFRHGKRPVTVRTFHEGGDGVLEVTDAGGWDLDPTLFDAFAAGDMTSTREQSGLGVGLFVATRLCDADGGRLVLGRRDGLTVAEARYRLDRDRN
jgi:signal transduction histidine kinase